MMEESIATQESRLYTASFFQVFAAAGLFMTGVSLQYHFGQYIEFLGYGVDVLGRILSISMLGTLLIRLHLGRWIDRFGCRPTWLVGTAAFALCLAIVQFTRQLWLITVLRAIAMMAMAAVMTTVAVFAALVAPPRRRAESIGTIGLAGFSGMIVGPAIGDWIFANSTGSATPFHVFFTLSALCCAAAGVVILFLRVPTTSAVDSDGLPIAAPLGAMASSTTARTSIPTGDETQVVRNSPTDRISAIRLLVRYWPGMILVVSVVFASAFCWQSMYLERMADTRGFAEIKVFFLSYCPSAILLRILGRRLPERIGRTRTLIGGMLLLAVGQLVLSAARTQLDLILPGMLMGAGHCFIFPSMVDLGADRWPMRYRGMGTAAILGAGDLGLLIGYFSLGELIDAFGYSWALRCLAITVLLSAGLLGFVRRSVVFARAGRGPTALPCAPAD